MNKKLISLAIAGAFASASPSIFAAEAMSGSVSGFVDAIFTLQDEAADDTTTDVDGALANPNNMSFGTNGEVDFMGSAGDVGVRVDLDVADSTTEVEQAKISWKTSDSLTVNIGQQNAKGLGFEGEDAPDLFQTSTGQLRNIVNAQSSEGPGNNVEGVILEFGAGPANISVGLLNDLHDAAEENSLLITAGGSPTEGLNLQLGVVTQADNTAANPNSLENIIDLYATYTSGSWWVNAELLDAGTDADGMVDTGFGLTGHVDFGNGFGGTLRYDTVSYNDVGATSVDDTTSTTVAGSYAAADNLGLVLEIRSDDNGVDTFNSVTLEALGTFGR